jgi:hypothetical protein
MDGEGENETVPQEEKGSRISEEEEEYQEPRHEHAHKGSP